MIVLVVEASEGCELMVGRRKRENARVLCRGLKTSMPATLLRNEKDEASPPELFLGGSSNLPPFLVCEVWRFFIF